MANFNEIAFLNFIGVVEEAENQTIRRRRRHRVNVDPFLILNENAFRKQFRLSKEMTLNLIELLKPMLASNPLRWDPKTKILATLNFFATGSYQTSIGNNLLIDLSQPTISRCIDQVVEVLNHPSIFNKWIRFPSTYEELGNISKDFYSIYDFPGIIGALDCTHIAIFPPSRTDHNEKSYVNRKGYHSINTQLICDSKLRILHVNALFPGSSHDCHVWNSSRVLNLLKSMHDSGHSEYHLIADSGYALRPWCLIPVSDAVEGTASFNYNKALRSARSTIERCNGLLKARFRCLSKHRVLHFNPTKASKIINACCVLHNMCIDYNIELDQEINNLMDDEMEMPLVQPNAILTQSGRVDPYLQLGRCKQAMIINNYFRIG